MFSGGGMTLASACRLAIQFLPLSEVFFFQSLVDSTTIVYSYYSLDSNQFSTLFFHLLWISLCFLVIHLGLHTNPHVFTSKDVCFQRT